MASLSCRSCVSRFAIFSLLFTAATLGCRNQVRNALMSSRDSPMLLSLSTLALKISCSSLASSPLTSLTRAKNCSCRSVSTATATTKARGRYLPLKYSFCGKERMTRKFHLG